MEQMGILEELSVEIGFGPHASPNLKRNYFPLKQ
jgi:hypothetical protein